MEFSLNMQMRESFLKNSKNLEEFENVMGISGWRDIVLVKYPGL